MRTKLHSPWKIAALCLLALTLAVSGWILFDRTVDRSGWVERKGSYSYRDFHGRKVTGWQYIDGST